MSRPVGRSWRRQRDERGQVSLLIIGLVAVLLLAVAVVTDASAAYLHRAGLDTVADGAALAAADALDERRAYLLGVGLQPDLDPTAGRAEIESYLRDTGAYARFPGLRVGARVSANEVAVTVTAPFDLPLHVPGARERVTVGATGSARLQAAG